MKNIKGIMKNKWVAYFLWLISGFGWFGLHNFYLNRPWRGVIWIFTQGLFWFGSAFDLLTIHKTVKDINNEFSYKNYVPSIIEFSDTSTSDNPQSIQKNYPDPETTNRESTSRLDLKDLFKIEVNNSGTQNIYEPFRITIKTDFDKAQRDRDVEYISSKEAPYFDFPKNENEDRNIVSNDNYDDFYYDRSKIYKTKLDLTNSELELIKYYRNSYRKFVEIEFCDLETVKLTLHLYHQLENLFISRKKDLEKKLNKEHKEIIADKKKEYLELYDYVPNHTCPN